MEGRIDDLNKQWTQKRNDLLRIYLRSKVAQGRV